MLTQQNASFPQMIPLPFLIILVGFDSGVHTYSETLHVTMKRRSFDLRNSSSSPSTGLGLRLGPLHGGARYTQEITTKPCLQVSRNVARLGHSRAFSLVEAAKSGVLGIIIWRRVTEGCLQCTVGRRVASNSTEEQIQHAVVEDMVKNKDARRDQYGDGRTDRQRFATVTRTISRPTTQ
ncbi:hypothetical protein KCU81_g584, partial [Aureobasidium melanogenum]